MFKQERFICDVLEDMRRLHDTRNYTLLPSLIEEAQIYANRMEDGLTSAKETARRIIDCVKAGGNADALEKIIRERYVFWPEGTQ